MTVNNLLSWKSTDGRERCLLIVIDEEKHHREIGYKKLELCVKNDEDQWTTVETVDSINEMRSFGIPPSFEN